MGHKVWPPNEGVSAVIAFRFPHDYRGFAVDVGASDGISMSSTYRLERSLGWKVICVEPNTEFKASLMGMRDTYEMCACADKPGEAEFCINTQNPEAFSSLKPTDRMELPERTKVVWSTATVPVTTVDALLEKHKFPQLDALCIDTEGTEMDVLLGTNLTKWKPRIIVSECWDEDGGAVNGYLAAHGYKRVMRSIHNDIYLSSEPF